MTRPASTSQPALATCWLSETWLARHGSGADNTHIGAMLAGSHALTMTIKARRSYEAAKGRGEPWP